MYLSQKKEEILESFHEVEKITNYKRISAGNELKVFNGDDSTSLQDP